MDETRSERPPIGEAAQHIARDFDELREAAERRGEAALVELRALVDRHPLASLGVAFGTGYLLSGAILSRLTLRLAAMGARFYAGRLLHDMLEPGAGAVPSGGGRT